MLFLLSVIIFCYHMKSHGMETLSHGETSKIRFFKQASLL